MEFNCSKCGGLCCVNPPALTSLKEISFAIEKGAKVIATRVASGYLVAIQKQNDVCPFLKEEKCSIHDDKFANCKSYFCNLHGKEVDISKIMDFSQYNKHNGAKSKIFSKKLLTANFENKIRFVSGVEFIKLNSATDMQTVAKMIADTLIRVGIN